MQVRVHSLFARRLFVIALAALVAAPVALGQIGGSVSGSGSTSGGLTDSSSSIDTTVDGSATTDGASGTLSGSTDTALGGSTGWAAGALDFSSEVKAKVPSESVSQAKADAYATSDAADRRADRARGVAAGIQGHYDVVGEVRQGDYSFMRVRAEAAEISGHTVIRSGGDASYLDRLQVMTDAQADLYETGTSTILWVDGARVEAKDTAEGSVIVQAAQQPIDLEIDLAAGTTVTTHAHGWLQLRGAGSNGALAISGPGSFDTSVEGRVTVHLDAWSRLGFETQRDGQGDQEFEAEQDATQRSVVGAEVRLIAGEAGMLAHMEALSVDVRAQRTGADRVTVEVESSDPRPRIVEVAFDAALFGNASDLSMTFDGVPAIRAESMAQVYLADHTETTYTLTSAGGNYRAVVWVEGFSVHELGFEPRAEAEIGSSQEDATSPNGERDGSSSESQEDAETVGVDSPGPGLPLVLLFMAAMAVIMTRRREP